VLFRGVS